MTTLLLLFCCYATLILQVIAVTTEVKGQKCTPIEPRDIYETCVLNYRDMSLWCDLTNLTRLPQPENIKSQAPCSKSSYLYMNDSCVDYLDPEVLDKYICLKLANFSDNLIENVANGTLKYQRYLTYFDLSRNKISTIDRNAFCGAKSLISLNLTCNKLSSMDPEVFQCVSASIESIDLSNNLIEILPETLFKNLCKLRRLLLTGNNFKTILPPLFKNVFHNCYRIGSANISNLLTSTNCSCQLVKYSMILHDNEYIPGVRDMEGFEMTCDFPHVFKGRNLSSLSTEDVCNDNLSITITTTKTSIQTFQATKMEENAALSSFVETTKSSELAHPYLDNNYNPDGAYFTSNSSEDATLPNPNPINIREIILITLVCLSLLLVASLYGIKLKKRLIKSSNRTESIRDDRLLPHTSLSSNSLITSNTMTSSLAQFPTYQPVSVEQHQDPRSSYLEIHEESAYFNMPSPPNPRFPQLYRTPSSGNDVYAGYFNLETTDHQYQQIYT